MCNSVCDHGFKCDAGEHKDCSTGVVTNPNHHHCSTGTIEASEGPRNRCGMGIAHWWEDEDGQTGECHVTIGHTEIKARDWVKQKKILIEAMEGKLKQESVCYHNKVRVRLYPNYTDDGNDAEVTCSECGEGLEVAK